MIPGKELERVVLNVGGRIFETTTRTLAHSSKYFASQFSGNWHQTWGEDQHLFIDQDPDAFAVLLSYMRSGFVIEEELTAVVLFQIEYFGLDDLVNEVKLISYRNHDSEFVGSDDEAIKRFGERFGSITKAVRNGFLPALIRVSNEEATTDYATLYLHYDGDLCDKRVIPCFAGLCTDLVDTDRSSLSDLVTDTGGFMNPVFALNFLGKHGFRLAPDHLQHYTSPSRSFSKEHDFNSQRRSLQCRGVHFGEWLFVRESQNGKEGGNLSICPSTIRGGNGPCEYASVVCTAQWGVFITAAGGKPIAIERLGGLLLRNVGIKRLRNMAGAMQWLDKTGFRKREEELEDIFKTVAKRKALRPTAHGYLETEVGHLMIFSRPIREQEPLLDSVIPFAFKSEVDDLPHRIVFPPLECLVKLPFHRVKFEV